MLTQFKETFLTCYNDRVPGWKKISHAHLNKDRSLNRFVKSIGDFISQNNLDPKRLVDSIVDFYHKKNGRYPNIFLYKGPKALSIYKNYELGHVLDLTKKQKIMVSVKKSKILLKNLEVNGIIYNEGVLALSETGKADPYFLLAHGIRENVSETIIKEWEGSDEVKKLVLDVIFN